MHAVDMSRLLKRAPRILSGNMHLPQENRDVFGSDLRRQKSSRNRAPEWVSRMLVVKLAIADRSAVAFNGTPVFCDNNPFDEAAVNFDLTAQVADVRVVPQQALNSAFGSLAGANECSKRVCDACIGWV